MTILDGGTTRGTLKLVTLKDADDEELVGRLSAWRKASESNFLTESSGRPQDAKRWLESLVLSGDMLWLVRLTDGRPIGHVGVKNLGADLELSHLLRGERGGGGDLMYLACKSVVEWCSEVFKNADIINQTFEDNLPATQIHELNGFKVESRVQVTKVTGPNGLWLWRPVQQNGERVLLIMRRPWNAAGDKETRQGGDI